jgi:uncharacterized protein involved in tellurium resistance
VSLFGRKSDQPVLAPEPVTAAPVISLTKGSAHTISMTKANPMATITAHLDWDGGSASRRHNGADLDLYVLYVPRTTLNIPASNALPGWAAYWNNLGSRDDAPYIQLLGDSQVPGRETAVIGHLDQQRYALICAYSAVGNGQGSFKSYGAHAVVTDGHDQTVTVPLFDKSEAYWVAIALCDFTDPAGVSIRQVERYSAPGSERRPVLHPDGTFLMDAGPQEFKTT